ncbi:MAG: hypothetical protein [Caudoviricetes sp.]|nr:MAG: hypothetical protein [Caudoviricetes sp.]
MNIDWSKAQEGSTHAFIDATGGSAQWRKRVGDDWFAYTKTYGWEEIVGRPEVYIARPENYPASDKTMIRRAQAEALLKLAEALEECERNGLTLEPDVGEYVVLMRDGWDPLDSYEDLSPVTLRMSITSLYPKSEEAE